jgi:hypothetical protein
VPFWTCPLVVVSFFGGAESTWVRVPIQRRELKVGLDIRIQLSTILFQTSCANAENTCVRERGRQRDREREHPPTHTHTHTLATGEAVDLTELQRRTNLPLGSAILPAVKGMTDAGLVSEVEKKR